MTREEAIKWIEEHNNPFMDETKDSQAHRLALDALRQPEIVRCKDCKHYRYYGLSQDTVSECMIDICENPAKDWFCADGER